MYVIAGEGEERKMLETYAKKLGVNDRVFFPGFVENAPQNLAGFDIFVLPSIKEGMPYVLLEAEFAGIPIVATSVIDDAFARRLSNMRVVPPHDATALADAIAEISSLPHTRKKHPKTTDLSTMVQKHMFLYSLDRTD